jgi:hypothetical protein
MIQVNPSPAALEERLRAILAGLAGVRLALLFVSRLGAPRTPALTSIKRASRSKQRQNPHLPPMLHLT